MTFWALSYSPWLSRAWLRPSVAGSRVFRVLDQLSYISRASASCLPDIPCELLERRAGVNEGRGQQRKHKRDDMFHDLTTE